MNVRSLFPLIALALLFGCQEQPSLPSEPANAPAWKLDSTAPDFTLQDPAGHPVSLSSLRGKVVLLDFWATWCAPCLSSVPELKSTWQKYRAKDFVILSISLDQDIAGWRSFIQNNGMDWMHVLDSRGASSATYRYGVDAIPTVFLIDRNGNVAGTAHFTSELEDQIDMELK